MEPFVTSLVEVLSSRVALVCVKLTKKINQYSFHTLETYTTGQEGVSAQLKLTGSLPLSQSPCVEVFCFPEASQAVGGDVITVF